MQIKNALAILLEAGYKAGVLIALENLIKKFMNDITLILIDTYPDLGLCFDTGHAELYNSWNDFLSTDILPRIVALHIHDNHGITDEHLIPGEGLIDFYHFIKVLFDAGYGGIWGIECKQHIGKYEGTPDEIAQKAYFNMEYIFNSLRDESAVTDYDKDSVVSMR